MKARECTVGRVFGGRLAHNADLLEDILGFARQQGVNQAFFSALGAVKGLVLAYYDQTSKKYQELVFEKPLEIASCFGNITWKDGKPHIHAHGVFADEQGHTLAGHIQPGTVLFAGEIFMQELMGEPLVREHDKVTGLYLWNL